jgi:PknH-like extracellular domain/TIR domain
VKAVLTMAHDVFISHSHEDKPAADAACAALEARGIRCWIAPRDIAPGQDWAASIVAAIQGAQIMLLVFSQHANQSPQVQREVERAASSGKVILPLRVDDVLPGGALAYYLGTPHWLDAITKPFEAHLEKLASACESLLAVTGRPSQDASSPVAGLSPRQGVTGPSQNLAKELLPEAVPSARPWWRRTPLAIAAGAVILVVVTATVVHLLAGRNSRPSIISQPSTTSQPVTTTAPPPPPPVAEAALDGLLLSPDQINTAMGTTGMTVTATAAGLDASDSPHMADKACVPLVAEGTDTAYAGSGWSAVRRQAVTGDSTHAYPAVVLFSSAHDADAFFTASAQSWSACSNRQFTFTRPGQPDVGWTVGPVSNTNGTLSATVTVVGTGPGAKRLVGQRALTVANNVAIDVGVAIVTQSDSQTDAAVNIAHQIAAKVPQ